MAGLLQIFLDIDRGLLVRAIGDPSPVVPGFLQGENLPVDLILLRGTANTNILAPHQVVTDATSCKIGLVTPGPSVSTIHAQSTLTYDAIRQLHSGVLSLATAAIATLLGASNSANTTLEVEVTSPQGIRTIQRAVSVNASGLKTSSTVPVPADEYLTKAQTFAGYVPRELGPGEPVVFTTPNGTKVWFWIDDALQPRYDLLG